MSLLSCRRIFYIWPMSLITAFFQVRIYHFLKSSFELTLSSCLFSYLPMEWSKLCPYCNFLLPDPLPWSWFFQLKKSVLRNFSMLAILMAVWIYHNLFNQLLWMDIWVVLLFHYYNKVAVNICVYMCSYFSWVNTLECLCWVTW